VVFVAVSSADVSAGTDVETFDGGAEVVEG